MSKGREFRAALLVAGTAIGGGILGLPVETGLGGFFPSLLIYFACWALMAATGLLFLETALWMKGETNIISMAKKTLGRPGEIFSWCLYLFLFYSLMLAYVSGCGNLIAQFFPTLVPDDLGPAFVVLFFGPFIFAGARAVGRVNTFLMAGLGILYFTFVYLGIPYVKPELLMRRDWKLAVFGLPVAFTAFAYQGVVPTLVHYLEFDAKKIRKAILIGSVIPLFAYIVWQVLILGIVPVEGPGGLHEAYLNGDNAVHPLRGFLNNPMVYHIGQYFAFFALITSFFGVGIGLLDFLADGLKVEKTAKGRLGLSLLVFLPPLAIASYNPHLFLVALSYAGGFGCALLLGLLPIMMVWKGRYKMKLASPYSLMGGKLLLALLALFILFEVAVQLYLIS